MADTIDPILGITPEKSSKPQLSPVLQGISDSHSSDKNTNPSRITPHVQMTGVDIGEDFLGNSNLDRVNAEFGGVNILTQDFNQLRAAEQPWYHQAVGFLNQAVVGEIVGGTIEGIGYLGEIPKAISMMAGNEVMFGNAMSEFGQSIRESAQEGTPIYQEAPGTFNMGDSGWWFGNAVSVASTLSLMIPAMGVTKSLSLLGKGARALAGASKIGRVERGTAAALEMISGATTSGKMFRASTTQAVFSRHMENLMEASGTFDGTYAEAIRLGVSEDQAKKLAAEAAATNYKTGWAMLAQDIVQYGLMAKFRMPGTMSTNKLEEALYKGLGKGKVAQFFNNNRYLGNGITQFLSEGAEESYQFLASEEAQYGALSTAGVIDESSFGDRLGDYTKDGEMWTSAFFGGFGGLASDVVGGRANRNELAEYQRKQVQWIRERGAKFAKMSNNVAKADASGDLTSMLDARRDLNMGMTIDALNHGTFEYHLEQMQEMQGMSDEKLAEYNQQHPGMEITPEFRDSILPKLIEDSKKVGAAYETNLDKGYVGMTAGLVTQLDYNAEYLANKAKENKNALSQSIDALPFQVENRRALDVELQLKALNAAKTGLEQYNKDTKDEFGKPYSEKRLTEINNEIDELIKEKSETKISKKDKENIKAILNNKEVGEYNVAQHMSSEYAELEGKKSSHYKSAEYQKEAEYKQAQLAIEAATDSETLQAIEKNIKTLEIPKAKKQELLNSIPAQEERIKNAMQAQAAANTEEAALTTPPANEVTTSPVEASEEGSALPPGMEEAIMGKPAAPAATPVQPAPTKEQVLPTGTKVRLKAGQFPGKEGVVIDGVDTHNRVHVQFKEGGKSHWYASGILEVIPEATATETNPTVPVSDMETLSEDEFAEALFPFFNAERSQGGKTVLNVGNNIEFNTETNLVPVELNGKYPGITSGKSQIEGVLPDGSKIGWKWKDLKSTLNSIILYNPDGSIKRKWERKETKPTSDIEAKKADIERRREASLGKGEYPGASPYIDTEGENIGEGYYLNAEGKEITTFDEQPNKKWTTKEIIDWLNAKYDAELAALESTQEKPTPTIPEDKTPASPADFVEEDNSTIGKLSVVEPKIINGDSTFYDSLQGWRNWLASGAKIDGAKVIVKPQTLEEIKSNPKAPATRLFNLFAKKQKGETLTPTENLFLIDNYPLKLEVLDTQGNPLVLGGLKVFNFLYGVYPTTPAIHVPTNRALRTTIITALANNGSTTLTLNDVEPSSTIETSADFSSIQENSISNLDGYRLTGNKSDFVLINDAGRYAAGKSSSVDLDIKSDAEKANPGDVFVKIKTPAGSVLPVKLNRRKTQEAEAELIVNILTDAMSNPNINGFISLVRIEEIPERAAQLKELLPNYEELMGKNPTLAEVKDFFIHHNNSDVGKRTNDTHYAPYKNDFFYMTQKGFIAFNYRMVDKKIENTDPNTGEVTSRVVSIPTKSTITVPQLLDKNSPERKIFKNLIMQYRHNIDLGKFKSSTAYESYLLDNKILNTHVSTKVFRPNSNSKISVNVKPTIEKEPIKGKSIREDKIMKKVVESKENIANAKSGEGVALNRESEAYKKLAANSSIEDDLLNGYHCP